MCDLVIEKAEYIVIESSEPWCWRRLLRVSWAANRFKQSMLKEISPGKTDFEDETAILSPTVAKSWHIWKAPDARKDWRWEEKIVTENEMVEWHPWLSQHGYGWTPGVGDEQGALAFCGPWSYKQSNMTEWLNWTEIWNSLVVARIWLHYEDHGKSKN